MEKAIEIRDLSKEYKIYGNPYNRIFDFLSRGKRRSYVPVQALKGINLEVPGGMTLGLVGENGAGKSTLLKILAGTSFPTGGSLRIKGRVASLLELGSGFSMEFTGLENIYMNAAMMGLSYEEVKKKLPEIIDFSGLKDFLHAPLRTYSSGMVCRLGFSTAIAVDPDILIVDEILAVGDMQFQKKCVEKIYSIRKQGKTIIFCSHSLYDVRQLCDEAVWIRHGRIRAHGNATIVTNDYATYEKELIGKEMDVFKGLPGKAIEGDNLPRIKGIKKIDAKTGEKCGELKPGDPLDVEIDIDTKGHGEEFHIGIGFTRTDTTLCFVNYTAWEGKSLSKDCERVRLKIKELELLSGEFVLFAWLIDKSGEHRFHQAICPENLLVKNPGKDVGLIRQEHQWNVERL